MKDDFITYLVIYIEKEMTKDFSTKNVNLFSKTLPGPTLIENKIKKKENYELLLLSFFYIYV